MLASWVGGICDLIVVKTLSCAMIFIVVGMAMTFVVLVVGMAEFIFIAFGFFNVMGTAIYVFALATDAITLSIVFMAVFIVIDIFTITGIGMVVFIVIKVVCGGVSLLLLSSSTFWLSF